MSLPKTEILACLCLKYFTKLQVQLLVTFKIKSNLLNYTSKYLVLPTYLVSFLILTLMFKWNICTALPLSIYVCDSLYQGILKTLILLDISFFFTLKILLSITSMNFYSNLQMQYNTFFSLWQRILNFNSHIWQNLGNKQLGLANCWGAYFRDAIWLLQQRRLGDAELSVTVELFMTV